MAARRPDREESDFPSVRDMEGWLQREIADVKRAAELRIKDATSFVTAYSRGEIASAEAAQLSHKYASRWGDPLPGISRSQGLRDEEILDAIDETRARGLAQRVSRKGREPGR